MPLESLLAGHVPAIEVEIKYRLDSPEDLRSGHPELAQLVFGPPERQIDQYFNHPQRNFAETHEALRIRSSGEQHCLTYKAPRLDTHTRTRPETEVPLGDDPLTPALFRSVLLALGFREIATITKMRRTATWWEAGLPVTVVLDQPEECGWFLELERIATVDTWITARDQLVALAERWGLTEHREPRSYLRMWLELHPEALA